MSAPSLLDGLRPGRSAVDPDPSSPADPRRPSVLRVVVTVQRLTLRVWFNELARSLGSRWQARLLLASLLALVVGYALWSSRQTADLIGRSGVTGLETTYGAVVFTVPALCALVAHLYVPPRTIVSEMLSTLPVGRVAAALATRSLTAMLGLGIGLVVLAPLWLPLLASVDLAALPVLLTLAVTAASGALSALALVVLVAQLLGLGGRIPPLGATGLAGLAVSAGLAAAFVRALPMNGNQPGGVLDVLTGGPLRWATGSAGVGAAAPLPGILLAALAVMLLLDSQAGASPESAAHVSLWTRERRVGHAPGLVALELRQLLRYPPNLLMLAFVNGAALLGVGVMHRSGQDQLGLGLITLTMLSAWGVGVYGPTRRHHWVYASLGRRYAWVLPKLVAALLVWGVFVLGQGLLLVGLTEWSLRDVAVTLPTLLTELLVGCTVGLLLPVGRSTSISGALSEAVALLLVMATGSLTQLLLAPVTSLVVLLLTQAAVAAAAATAYLLTARRVAGAASGS